MNYSTGSGHGAVLQYASGSSKMIYMGFPLESIYTTTQRNSLMAAVLTYFGTAAAVPAGEPGFNRGNRYRHHPHGQPDQPKQRRRKHTDIQHLRIDDRHDGAALRRIDVDRVDDGDEHNDAGRHGRRYGIGGWNLLDHGETDGRREYVGGITRSGGDNRYDGADRGPGKSDADARRGDA